MTHDTRRPRAVVTGGSSGIGRAVVVHLADAGWDVAVGYRQDRQGAEQALASIRGRGAEGLVFQMEASDPRLARARFEDVVEQLGGIDTLVSSAGVNRRRDGVEETVEGVREVLAINAETPIALAQSAARAMQAGGGGAIIHITSVHEHIPIVGGTAYCASKAALGAATQVLALEMARQNISVNAVAPGETATPMNGVPDGVGALDIARPAIPAGRPASADEVAALVTFLAGTTNRYITGQSIVVDGGMRLTAAVENATYAGRVESFPREK